VLLTEDTRVHKVEMVAKDIAPDKKVRTSRISFQDANFWFIKGYDQAKLKQQNSAIDSYRQTIRLDPRHAAAMHNLANQCEI